MKRIRRLLYPKGPNGVWTPLCASVVFLATAALAVVALQAAPAQENAETLSKLQAEQAAPYQRWLNEEVVYIISDTERAAFLKLTTDEEREKFIEQFWQRRDPKQPGTVENEFKEEHFRRIAFANEHYRTPLGTPGWKSDRGRMYIVYGPPDEIDSHPTPREKAYGYETWLYQHVEGIGDRVTVTFVDRTGAGDYRIAPGK